MNKKILIGLVIVAVIAIITSLVFTNLHQTKVGTVSYTSPASGSVYFPTVGTSQIDVGYNCDQQYTCTKDNSLKTYVSTGALTFGTTTLAVIPNPFASIGTSTVSVAYIYGAAGTTSMIYQMGTSTITTGQSLNFAGTNISPTLINTLISTSSTYYLASGVTQGSSQATQPSASSNGTTYTTITVAPNESIVIFATSTSATYATGLQGAIGVGTPANGTYKIEWQR